MYVEEQFFTHLLKWRGNALLLISTSIRPYLMFTREFRKVAVIPNLPECSDRTRTIIEMHAPRTGSYTSRKFKLG